MELLRSPKCITLLEDELDIYQTINGNDGLTEYLNNWSSEHRAEAKKSIGCICKGLDHKVCASCERSNTRPCLHPCEIENKE